jgi:hypothetical protein
MKILRVLPLVLCLLGLSSFASAQTPLTPEIDVVTASTGFAPRSTAMNARGEFVVTWVSSPPAPPGEASPALFARWFAADGTPGTGEILVSGDVLSAYDHSAVAIREDGSFLVLHHRLDPDGVERLKGRFFAPNGTPLGDVFPVVGDFVLSLSVAAREDGGFVVAWIDQGNRIVYRLFDSEGGPVGPERRLGIGAEASVAAGPRNEMVVVWEDWSPQSSLVQAVAGQRLRPDGIRRGKKFLVNQPRRTQIVRPQVAFDGAGNFLILWYDRGIRARLYGKGGAARSRIFRLSSGFPGAGIAMDREGNFALAWPVREEGASPVDLVVRRFENDGSPLGPAVTVSSSELLLDLAIAGDEAGRFVVVWTTDQNHLRAQVFSAE